MQFTTDLEIKGLSPAAICHCKNMAEKVTFANWPVKVAKLVMQFITALEIKGSNPTAVCHHKKMAETSFLCPLAS